MVTDLKIASHKGVGEIKFGMTAEEVRCAVSTDFETFKRNSKRG